MGDFSVVLFRPHFMLFSEKNHMKVHKNQCLSNLLSPPDSSWGSHEPGHVLWLSLSRLNHWLPGTQAHPEVMQGTTEFHHQIADTFFP
jgi:hypothetical protein